MWRWHDKLARIMLEGLVAAIHILGKPVMKMAYSERSLAKKVTILLGDREPESSVQADGISRYTLNIRNESHWFMLSVTRIDARIFADGVEISTAALTTPHGLRDVEPLCTRTFEIPAARLTFQARDVIASLRTGPPNAVDRLNATLSVTATAHTWFRELSVSCELPVRILTNN